MLTLLDKITGLIAPHECLGCGFEGKLLCPACISLLPDTVPRCYRCSSTKLGDKTCAMCRKHSPLEYVRVCTIYEGVVETLIHRMKFERALAGAETVAQTMALLHGNSLPEGVVLVPVPTATSRVRQRGYDQSVQIARHLALLTDRRFEGALVRYGQQRQTGSSRRDRQKQIDGAYGVRKQKLAGISSAVLVDDVLTTGATLEAAARTLRRTGVKHVSALVFARAE